MRSARCVDVLCPAPHVFAVLTDASRIDEWSTLFSTTVPTNNLANGEHVALRLAHTDDVIDAAIELGDDPFHVSYEGKTDNGTRYALHQRVEAGASGASIELMVEIEAPPGAAGTAEVHELQRDLDADVDRMAARVYLLLDRSRGPRAWLGRDDFLPDRARREAEARPAANPSFVMERRSR